MSSGRKSDKSLEFEISKNTKTLEKNPKRGGTPASESIVKLKILV